MHGYSTPLSIEIPSTGNLTDDVVRHAAERPDAPLFSRKRPDGWTDVTAAEFVGEVRAVAKGLVAAGIGPGDRVALLSRTRYEWTLIDYAIWFAGAVTVPIYESSSAEQIAWILADSQACAIVAETETHLARIEEGRAGVAERPSIWSLEAGAVDALVAAGAGIDDEEIERRRQGLTPDTLATLVYTSGTTGRPKGCMLTHGNFMCELEVAVKELHALFEEEGSSTLLFLPLAHVFARIIEIGAVKAGARLGHSSDVSQLAEDLEGFRPTFILAVPRVFEKIFNTASLHAAANGRSKIFDRAVDTAIAYSRALDSGRPGVVLRLRHRAYDKLVYDKLRTTFGGRCRYSVSGGAPLGERLGHFLRGVGLTVLEGYGLTETTAAVTANLPDTCKIGTVGRPLPGVSVRTADDGELLVRGGQVFTGYWRDPAATAEVLDEDGWLRTGDLAEIDDEGFVRITGRKKEVIVTAGGKNVAPSTLENRLRAHPLVSQCMVVGDGRPFIAALVTIDPDSFSLWAEQHGKTGSVAELADDPDLVAEVQSAVDEANKAVSRAEAIRKFQILPTDWSEEAGQLTASLKVRRSRVASDFRLELEALFER